MDFYLLVSLYVLVDEWWQETHPPTPKKAGRPPSLSASEVLALAVPVRFVYAEARAPETE